jgi:predicted nucleic acid-binding Zn ribbon protein
MPLAYTYKCLHCNVQQDVRAVNDFRHAIDCPMLIIPDDPDAEPPDQFAELERVWKPTPFIIKGKR